MRVNIMKAILFDFDGVLHDTFEFHREKIAEFTGSELSPQEYRDMHNGNFFGHAIPELRSVDWVAYRDSIEERFGDLEMTEEVREVLRRVSQGKQMFVVSAGGTRLIEAYLRRGGVGDLFREVLGGDFLRSKAEKFRYISEKYAFDIHDALFVTDTLGDILEAHEVGIKTIAVDFGFHSRETLEKGKPYAIISRFEELPEIMEKLF